MFDSNDWIKFCPSVTSLFQSSHTLIYKLTQFNLFHKMYIIQNFQDVPRFAEINMSHCDSSLSF